MAEGGMDNVYEMDTVDVQIVEYNDSEEDEFMSVFPTENRFVEASGYLSGRGDGLTQKRRAKRKKVSSAESTESIDKTTFNSLKSNDKLSYLNESVTSNFVVMNEIKNEQILCQTAKELKTRVDKLCEQAIANERIVQRQNEIMKIISYRFIDSEAKNRRNNLIVWGVSEKCNISVETLIKNFFAEEMQIDSSYLDIANAHRIGSVSQRSRDDLDPRRPIIVRFSDYSYTERVMKRAFKLKGTPFGIDRDYPRDIAVARKELYKSEEATRARQNRNKVQIKYPAKLFINGILINDKFPEWNQYVNGSPIACLKFDQKRNDGENKSGSEQSEISESSDYEHGDVLNDSVFSSGDSDGRTDADNVKIAGIDNSQNGHLLFAKMTTNKESRDVGQTHVHSRKNRQLNLPKYTRSQSSPTRHMKKRTHKQSVSHNFHVKQREHFANIKTRLELDTCKSQPVDTCSKNRYGENQNNCIMIDGILVATEDCDTHF